MLNEIYHTQIQYAYKYNVIDLDELVAKFKTNQKLYPLCFLISLVLVPQKFCRNAREVSQYNCYGFLASIFPIMSSLFPMPALCNFSEGHSNARKGKRTKLETL